MSTMETQLPKTNDLYEQAMKLSPEQRLELSERLVASVPMFPDVETEERVADVVERRWNEIVEGKVKTVPGNEVFRRIQQKLDKQDQDRNAS